MCYLTANWKDFVKYDFYDIFGSTESKNNQHQLPKLQGVAFQKNHEKFIEIPDHIVIQAYKLFNAATFPTYLVKKAITRAFY